MREGDTDILQRTISRKNKIKKVDIGSLAVILHVSLS